MPIANAIMLFGVGSKHERSKTKALETTENDATRAFVRELAEREWPKVQPAGKPQCAVGEAAAALGIAQATLSDFLAGKGGAGAKLLRHVVDYVNQFGGAPITTEHITHGGRLPAKGQRWLPVPIEIDPYADRVIVRRRPYYATYAPIVREIFESLSGEAGNLNDPHDWQKWLDRIDERHKAWAKAGAVGELTLRPVSASSADTPRVKRLPSKTDSTEEPSE